MRIGIVIATHNRRELLDKLLSQAAALAVPPGFSISKIVIVDGSTDGTAEMLAARHPDVTVIHGNGEWWWTRCMNAGFRKAIEMGLDAVLIMNDDVELRNDYIGKLLRDYRSLPAGSILGSASISVGEPHVIEASGTFAFNRVLLKFRPYHPGLQPLNDVSFKGVHPTYSLAGRGTLIPAETFGKIGFYDENLVQYGSDDEFVLRARRHGLPVFISWNARVYTHLYLTSAGTAYRKDRPGIFLKSFFSPYSVNSLKKVTYLYCKYGYRLLLPVFLPYFILGAVYAKYIKYR
jgi:GT2 family glycosyltransferase